MDTLDPPVRKKISWPLEPPVSQCLGCSVLLTDNNVCYGRTTSPSRPPDKDASSSKKDGSEDRTKPTQDACSCRKERNSKDPKYGKIYAENGRTSGDVYSETGRKKPDSKVKFLFIKVINQFWHFFLLCTKTFKIFLNF